MSKTADKLYRKVIEDQQKRITPGECVKHLRLVLDINITSLPFSDEFLKELSSLNIEIRELPQKFCLLFERNVGQRKLLAPESDLQLASDCMEEVWQKENHVLRFFSPQELQKEVRDDHLERTVHTFRLAFPNMKHTLVMSQIKENGTSPQYYNALQTALVDLQIMQQVSSMQVPWHAKELADVVKRFFKAVAEAPYKQQKFESICAFKKYVANDKKQCVRIDGDSGYRRLWQQHLNRLPMVTLEIAETIIGQYPFPRKLLDEYDRSARPNIEKKIADLKINRGCVQPFQTERRVGNVLSSKLFTLYNSRDPNALI